MSTLNTASETAARAYCLSIGADPEEFVHGVDERRFGHRMSMLMPRWRWYVGARPGLSVTTGAGR